MRQAAVDGASRWAGWVPAIGRAGLVAGCMALFVVVAQGRSSPEVAGWAQLDVPVEDMAVAGGHAYVVGGTLAVVDIAAGALLTTRSLEPWRPRRVTARTDTVFALGERAAQPGQMALLVVDVARPEAPVLLSEVQLPHEVAIVYGLGARPDYVYLLYRRKDVAAGAPELAVIGVRDRRRPGLVALIPRILGDGVPGADDLAVGSSRALASTRRGVRELDLSRPHAPELAPQPRWVLDGVPTGALALDGAHVAVAANGAPTSGERGPFLVRLSGGGQRRHEVIARPSRQETVGPLALYRSLVIAATGSDVCGYRREPQDDRLERQRCVRPSSGGAGRVTKVATDGQHVLVGTDNDLRIYPLTALDAPAGRDPVPSPTPRPSPAPATTTPVPSRTPTARITATASPSPTAMPSPTPTPGAVLPVAVRRRPPGPATTLTPGPARRKTIAIDDQLGGAMRALADDGDRLFLGRGPRVVVARRQSAAAPSRSGPSLREIGQSDVLPGVVEAMAVDDARMIAALGTGGATVLDVRGPAPPRLVRRVAGVRQAWDVAALDGTAYVAAGIDGLAVHTLADGAATRWVSADVLGGARVRAVAASSAGLVYALVETDGRPRGEADVRLVVLGRGGTIGEPPRRLGAVSLGSRRPEGWPVLAVRGHQAYAVVGGALLLVDVGDPTAPAVAAEQHGHQFEALGLSGDAVFAGFRTASAPGVAAGVMTFARGSLSNGVLVEVAFPDQLGAIHVVGDELYVSVSGVGLWELDVRSLPGGGALRAVHPTSGVVRALTPSGGRLLAAGERAGLTVVEVTSAGTLELLGRTARSAFGAGQLRSVTAVDMSQAPGPAALVSVAAPEVGRHLVQEVDITRRAVPRVAPATLLARVGPLRLGSVERAGVLLAIERASGGASLMALDVGVSGEARVLGERTLPAANDLARRGEQVVVAGRGVTVIDVGDPMQLAVLGRWSAPGDAVVEAVAVAAASVYGVTASGTVFVLDITRPTQPRRVATLSLPGGPLAVHAMALVGPTLVVGTGEPWYAARVERAADGPRSGSPARLYIIDVSDASRPKLVGQQPVPGAVSELRALPGRDGRFAVAAADAGLLLARVAGPGSGIADRR